MPVALGLPAKNFLLRIVKITRVRPPRVLHTFVGIPREQFEK
jgi:hypothetical protein